MRIFLTAAVLAATSPAVAQNATPATDAKPKKERLICKRSSVSESRVTKRVCKTGAQWRTGLTEEDQNNLDIKTRAGNFRDNRGSGSRGGPGA